MFVLGLVIGPAIGLLLVHLCLGRTLLSPRVGLLALGCASVLLLSLPAPRLEVRLGLLVGTLLGVLLASSTHSAAPMEEVE